jgi:hypothetical protein
MAPGLSRRRVKRHLSSDALILLERVWPRAPAFTYSFYLCSTGAVATLI